MTEALYLDDSYLKEFEAEVVSVKDGKYIILDKTLFYYSSGGQPYDTGKLTKDGEEFNVVFVGKFSGEILHEIDKLGLKKGDKVKGVIDWDRRYRLMRSHTAAHVLSAVFHKEAGALITGNQLNVDKSRIDFSLGDFDRGKINEYFEKANEYVKKDLQIKTYYMLREAVEKVPEMQKLAKGLLEGINNLRIVEIEELDKQADGGTHVKSLKEVGEIKFLKADNKGKNNRRVYFSLDSS